MNLPFRGAVGAALVLVAAIAPAAPEGWYQSLDEAIVAARKEGKPILADFSTSWCHNCRSLEQYTLSNPEVTERLKSYVKVYVDGDRHRQTVSQFGVQGYPTLVTISPEGYELNRSVGYVEANQLAATLDGALQAVGPRRKAAPQPEREIAAAGPSDDIERTAAAVQTSIRREEAPARPQMTEVFAEQEFQRKQQVAETRPQVPAEVRSAQVQATPDREINYYTLMAGGAAEKRTRPHVELAANRTDMTRIKSAIKSEIAESDSEPASEVEEVVAAAEEESGSSREEQNVRAAADPAADQLPRPLLDAGKTREADVGRSTPAGASADSKESAAPAVEQKPQAVSETGESKPKSAPSASASKSASAPKSDVLKTVRKLQLDDEAPAKSEATKTEKPAEMKPAEKVESSETPAAKPKLAVRKAGAEEAKPETETAKPTPRESVAENETPVASPAESAKSASSDVPTRDEVQRWMKTGDEKLVGGFKKEAHAQYSKIVERDPNNSNGMTDLAFIKMVALMVDRDDESLRQQAYNKIREFEARFPDSPNKDYYTVIRAMFAADLGKFTEAHALLDDFPTRFPNSRYIEMAHETWQGLPPAGRERSEASSRNSGSTGRATSRPASGSR